MLNFNGCKVYLACGATDFRNSINGLTEIVQMSFGQNPFDGSLYVFCNRKKDGIKILEWDRDGMSLYYKRLERGTYRWPDENGSQTMELTAEELSIMLESTKLVQKLRRRELHPRYAC
jgi:transposase